MKRAGPAKGNSLDPIEATLPLNTFDWTDLSPGGRLPRDGRRLLAGRYALGKCIGSGGQGSVYDAEDLLTRESIAIKILPVLSTAARHRVNLEITALRWLRMPGVVRLRDDGVIDDMIFLVMDRVRGQQFPAGPMPWETLRPLALSLLETLDAVHASKVLHRDLKPTNILMDEEGRPVLIDFGLARGQAIAVEREQRQAGTFQYCPPEQLKAMRCDERSDLYSLGVVLYEALTGTLPFGHDHREILRRHNEGQEPKRPEGAPPEVVSTVLALLRRDPDGRPSSAAQVIEMLGGLTADRRIQDLCSDLPEQATQEEIEALFCGPDLFLHLREDAAAILYAETRGWRSEIVRELGRWLRQGLVHYREGLLSVSRVAIDHLGEPAPPLTLTVDEAIEVLREQVQAHLDLGRVSQALGRLDRAVGLARRFKRTHEHRQLLELWVEAALFMQDTEALDRCLCELGRGEAGGVEVEDLGRLVRGAWCAERGEPERGQALLAPLGSMPTEALEHCAQAARVVTAARTSLAAEEAAVDQSREWATIPLRRSRYLSWQGLLEYRRGHFEAALAAHQEALALETSPHRQVKCLLNGAGAALEVPDLDLALELSEKARDMARGLRLPHAEAGAFRLERAVRYRREERLIPDVDAVDAIDSLGPWRTLAVALTEAAIAWRAGDHQTTIELALRGRAAARVVGFDDAMDLAQGLAEVAGHPPFPAWTEREKVPALAAQARALRAIARGPQGPDHAARTLALCEAAGMHASGPRRDVLTYAEILRACEFGHL